MRLTIVAVRAKADLSLKRGLDDVLGDRRERPLWITFTPEDADGPYRGL
jgi:hypothetical protein